MSNNDESDNFFNNNTNQDQSELFVEIPTQPRPLYQDRLTSGYDPMGEIYLRGRAMRSMSSGGMPWWVLISGWILFGGLLLLIVGIAISSLSWDLLPSLIFAAIPVWIVWRGTLAKLSLSKRRSR